MQISQGCARDFSELTLSEFMHWWLDLSLATRAVLFVSSFLIVFSLYGSLVAPYIGWELPLVIGAFFLGKNHSGNVSSDVS